jgi:hypothetical protein
MKKSEPTLFEIYTKNPETGKGGWDIKFVLSHPQHIKRFPNFDCIISKGFNGFTPPQIVNWIFPT